MSGSQELPPYGVPSPPPIRSLTSPITANTLKREAVNIDNSPLTTPLNSSPVVGLYTPSSQSKSSSPNPIQKESPSAGAASSNNLALLPSPLDRIEILAKEFLRKCSSQPLNLTGISEDVDGIKMLAKSGCWKEVVKLSSKLLSDPAAETVVSAANKSLLGPLYRFRFEGLFKMKMYDDLNEEVGSILSSHNCEKAINVTVRDPMYDVILSMKLILIEIKMMSGHSQDALERLHYLQRVLGTKYPGPDATAEEGSPSTEEQDSYAYWSFQIKLHIINAFFRLRQWKSAYDALRKVAKEVQTLLTTDGLYALDKKHLTKALILLLTRLSRTSMHLGAVSMSQAYYDKATKLMDSDIDKTANNFAELEQHLLLNEALLSFGRNEFEKASELFLAVSRSSSYDDETIEAEVSSSTFQNRFSRLCSKGDPISTTNDRSATNDTSPISASICVPTSKRYEYIEVSVKAILDTEVDTFTVCAVNNYSICAMYLKRINEAISRLEALILLNPIRNMVDPVVFNVCTLYDLSYAPEISTTKKNVLQKVAMMFHIEDPVLHFRSFRLN